MNMLSRYAPDPITPSIPPAAPYYRKMYRRLCVAAPWILVTGLFSTFLHAESWQFDAGVVATARQQPWLDIEADQQLLPMFSARYGNWQFGMADASLVSYRWQLLQHFSLQLGAGIRDLGYGAKTQTNKKYSKAAVFRGYQIPDPEAVINVTLQWQWFSLQLGQQLNDGALGLQAKAGVQMPLWQNEQGANLALLLEARYLNEDLAQRIYGVAVEDQDLSVGRPQFYAPSAVNPAIALQLTYPFNRQWVLLATLSAEQLDTELQASPLVGRERITELMLVANYRF